MPMPMPMRYRSAVVLTALLLATASACSDDAAVASGQDTEVGDDTGDINTDLFTPGDGGDSEDDGGSDLADTAIGDGSDDSGGGGDTLDRYESCGFGGPQCAAPLTCVGNCQLPCSAGCPEDEECIDLGGFGAAGVCGVRGGEGTDCDVTMGQFCAEGLSCSEGSCTAPTIGGEGDPCGGFDQQCDEGLACVFTGFGEGLCQETCEGVETCEEGEVCLSSGPGGPRACFEDCDPSSDPVCSDNVNYQCRAPIGGNEAACLPRLGDPPGEQGFGERCGGQDRCQDGLFCPGLAGSYCTTACGDAGDCPSEPAGAECVSLAVQGVCTFTCPTGDAAECPEGMTCSNVFGQNLCAWP